MTNDSLDKKPVAPSKFVTNLAWVSIVISGLMVLVTVFQNVVLFFMIPKGQMDLFVLQAQLMGNLPPSMLFVIKYFRWIFFSFFIFSILFLWISWALLKRKEWARKLTVFLLWAGIIVSLLGVLTQNSFVNQMVNPDALQVEAQKIMMLFKMISWIMTAIILGVHYWLIRKLSDEKVVAEFNTEKIY